MFDKTLNAFSKFATLGRPGKDRKRRASIGALTFAADDTNNDRDDTRSKTLQRSTAIDLNSDVVLQLNKGLMRRSQSTESLNISLHQTWRTIDIDIDSPPSPVDDYEENPYQDLNLFPQSRNNEGNNSHAESESGSDQDVEAIETNNDFQGSAEGENLYEDTDFVREVLNSPRLPQVETVRTSRTRVKEPQCVLDNGLEGTTATTTMASSPNQNHSTDQSHVQICAANSEKVTNLDKSSNIKESQSDDDNTPIDDECDTDNEYHDTVVKDLNVIEISEQGIVSRLRTAEAEEEPREEGVDGDITESMDNYFQKMGIMRVDDDEEEEEEEEEIEEDGIKSKRQLDEIEQELHVDENMEDNEEAMLELNEVLNKFEMIEEDTRKDVEDIDTSIIIHTETKTKPKLLPKPKPKPPLKPKPVLRPAKSLGTLHSSGTKKVGAIVTSFECESLPKVNVQLQAPSLATKSSPDKMKQSCDTGGNENVHKPGSGSMASDSVRPKEIASKLTAIFAKESAMRPVKPPPLSPKPSAPVLGGTGGGGFVGKSRFDSECESLHSGTDVSCSSEQSSGTGSIGSPSLLPLPVQVPSPCVLPKPWSDQSSMTSYDGPNCSISSSEDFPSEQKQQISVEDDGDDNVGINDVTSRTRAGTKVGAKGRGRQVSQRWQRNHLKKVSAQLQSGGGVKRTFNKIQNAENLKRFSNYLANKRPSLDLLSEPIQR